MTENANFKRRVRARAAKTGESYTAARHQLLAADSDRGCQLTIATAQCELATDPRSAQQLHEAGLRVQRLMRDAAMAGASLVHLPEGALCAPHKRVVSSLGPEVIAEADWRGVDHSVMRAELDSVTRLAQELRLWVVVGGIDFMADGARPTNSLSVISDEGQVVGRYDERMLSRTKSQFMYDAGLAPLVFEVNGVRFGCLLGMESQYPELFAAYEREQVHCILLSTAGNPEHPQTFAIEAAGHAASNSLWVSYAGPIGGAPAGIISPTGEWAALCDQADKDALAVAELETLNGQQARDWRRLVRKRLLLQ